MRTLIGVAFIVRVITEGLRLAGALLLMPVRAATLVTPGPVGTVARRIVVGVGGGAAIVALLIARVHAAGVEGVPPAVTDRLDAFAAAGRHAIGREVCGSDLDLNHALCRSAGGVVEHGRGPVSPKDTSLAALLAAAQHATSRVQPRWVAHQSTGGARP